MLTKNDGMRYITITAKYHDGFCLFHTKQTKWNIVDQDGYVKDIIRELALAFKEHGIRLVLYYSPLDWNHPDYYPRGFTDTHTGRTETDNWSVYHHCELSRLYEPPNPRPHHWVWWFINYLVQRLVVTNLLLGHSRFSLFGTTGIRTKTFVLNKINEMTHEEVLYCDLHSDLTMS